MRADAVAPEQKEATTQDQQWELIDGAACPPPNSKWRMNKWVIVVLCIAWIVSPLDGDFIPVIGWIDDLFAAYIAYRQISGK
jgi:Protein of unknown function (DUF1232)